MKLIKITTFLFLLLAAACSTLTLKPTDFAWPLESVLKADENGKVSEDRYAIEFDTRGVFYEELKDSSAYKDTELRVLRNMNGYYFITANKFKNVYIFEAEDGALVLENKILISESGMENPAMNQRKPFVELIDGDKTYNLTRDGIDRTEK